MRFRSVSSRDAGIIFRSISIWLVRPVNRIGRVKHGVYWCIYACIGRMYVRCESSTYVVDNGVVSVPIYQSNDIVGSLITIVSYVITKQQPLQGYLVRLN